METESSSSLDIFSINPADANTFPVSIVLKCFVEMSSFSDNCSWNKPRNFL